MECYGNGQFLQAAKAWEDVVAVAEQVPRPEAQEAKGRALRLLAALCLDTGRFSDGRRMAEAAAALPLPPNATPALERNMHATLLALKTKELLQNFNATHMGMTKEQALRNPAVLKQLPLVQEVNSLIGSLRQAVEAARAAGDAASVSAISVTLGTLLNQINGQAQQARACLAEAQQSQASREKPDRQQEAFLLTQLAVACRDCGDLPAAVAHLKEAEQRQIALQRTRQGAAAVTIAELQQETYLQLQDSLMQQRDHEAALLAAERSRVLALQQFLEEAGRGSANSLDSPAGNIGQPEISQAVASSGELIFCPRPCLS